MFPNFHLGGGCGRSEMIPKRSIIKLSKRVFASAGFRDIPEKMCCIGDIWQVNKIMIRHVTHEH